MSKLRVGDWVEVRAKDQILRTLDKRGRLEGMPFMPQMFQYCGKRFKVFKRAHKTCDTIAIKWDYPGPKRSQWHSSRPALRRTGLWRLSSRLPNFLEGAVAQAGQRSR